jgi:hypothetical protein
MFMFTHEVTHSIDYFTGSAHPKSRVAYDRTMPVCEGKKFVSP